MAQKKQRLKVESEFRARSTNYEVIAVAIDADDDKYYLIVEHLASRNCIVIDLLYPDESRVRVENIYYGG